MTLLETVDKLQEIERKAAKETPPGTMRENAAFCLELRNAATDMLAALGQIHDGDAAILEYIMEAVCMQNLSPDQYMLVPVQQKICRDCLSRLLEMCRLMEAQE